MTLGVLLGSTLGPFLFISFNKGGYLIDVRATTFLSIPPNVVSFNLPIGLCLL